MRKNVLISLLYMLLFPSRQKDQFMVPEREKTVAKTYNKLLAISLNQAPIDEIEEIVAPDVTGFGTTIDEKIHDLKGYANLIRGQEEKTKAAGVDFNYDAERIQ